MPLNRSHGPFRSRSGLLLGVIKGLAEHYGLPTWLLRVLTIALAAMVTFWPVVIVYVLVAIFMPLRPMGSRVF